MSFNSTHTIRLSEAPFALECGASLVHVDIGFTTYGELAQDASNVIFVAHALTGWTAVDEWWTPLIGEGKLLDPTTHFIICPNILGSCYGTTGPESIDPKTGKPYHASFPQVTIRDIARANLRLLEDLGIHEVQLSIGGSLGGMVILEMAALADGGSPARTPDLRGLKIHSLVPVAVSGSHSAWRIAFSSAIRKTIIAHDPTLHNKAKLTEGMKLARQVAMTSYRSSEEFEQRFARERVRVGGHTVQKFEVENYLEHQGEKIAARFSPYSYLALTRAMELYDLAEGRASLADVAQSIDIPALFVGISSDLLYPENEIEQFASLFPRGAYATLEAVHGHDSFLVDAEDLVKLVRPFVDAALDNSVPSLTRSLKATTTNAELEYEIV